jgi:hypothetical protein
LAVLAYYCPIPIEIIICKISYNCNVRTGERENEDKGEAIRTLDLPNLVSGIFSTTLAIERNDVLPM